MLICSKIGLRIILLLGRGTGSDSKQPINTSGVGSCILQGSELDPLLYVLYKAYLRTLSDVDFCMQRIHI